MIVRDDAGSLIVMTQPDHAALSGRIMEAWRADALTGCPTRSSVLLATREHDNGWQEIDCQPRVEPVTGRPYDFINAPADLKQQVWPRGVTRLSAEDMAAAALVAQHPLTVLERNGTLSWSAFFARMEAERDRLLSAGAYDNELEALLADYRFVFLGDLLSLVFCCGWTQLFERHDYAISLRGGTILTVDPDPFGGVTVPLVVPARRVPNRRYTSDEDFQRELDRATTFDMTGMARRR